MARRSENSSDKNFNDNGIDITLREDALEPRKIPQLSLNVLGGLFLPKHTKFKVKMNTIGDEKWTGRPVYLVDCRNHYTELENGSTIYFNANALHGALVDYERPKDKNSEKIYEDFHSVVNGKYKLKAQITIAHEPTNMNYWHSELKVWLDGKELLPGESAKWMKGVGQQIISDLICMNAYPELPKNHPINPKYFYKPTKNNWLFRFLNKVS